MLKMVEWTYLNEKSSDFDETWYTASDIAPDDRQPRDQKQKFL